MEKLTYTSFFYIFNFLPCNIFFSVTNIFFLVFERHPGHLCGCSCDDKSLYIHTKVDSCHPVYWVEAASEGVSMVSVSMEVEAGTTVLLRADSERRACALNEA